MIYQITELIGRPASGGFAKGPAFVLDPLHLPPDDQKISQQNVIIVHNLTPDLIIKIAHVKGIVAEVGGVTSHAATIARELGVPCVIAISDAITRINDGQWVEVDGDRGIVRIYSNRNGI